MRLAAGTRLGPYEILAPLGAGGMGEVWRARDTKLGREVALKVLPEAWASDPDRLARFEREAQAVAALNHPNIVTVHSVDVIDEVRFITMELVEGQTLADLIPARGLSPAALLRLAIPLADALAAAHARGVELWRTDGTGSGTQLFLDIASGLEGSYPRCLTELGGLLYFAAYRAGEGSELWRTDGTLPGTALVADLAAGDGSSSPCGFACVGNRVLFTAWEETYGRELRVIDDLGQLLLPTSFEDGTFGDWSLFVH